jgi:hypothetical protein
MVPQTGPTISFYPWTQVIFEDNRGFGQKACRTYQVASWTATIQFFRSPNCIQDFQETHE